MAPMLLFKYEVWSKLLKKGFIRDYIGDYYMAYSGGY